MARSEKGKHMSAPSRPTDEETAETEGFRWEYEQQTVDVSDLADPPDSRPPHVVVRRRIVGPWKVYNPDGVA